MRFTRKSKRLNQYIRDFAIPDVIQQMTQKLGQYEDIDESPEHLADIKKALGIIKKLLDKFELPMGKETSEVVYKAIKKGIDNILTQEEFEFLKGVLL